MEKKIVSFLLIGILVGAAAGVGIGFAMFNQEQGTDYWVYVDYGSTADATHKNGWVSVTAVSTLDALKKVPGMKIKDGSYGPGIDGINGIMNKTDYSKYWGFYVYNGDYTKTSTFEKSWSYSNFGINKSYTTCMYLFYQSYTDAPTDAGWVGTGPLKA